MAVAVRGNVKWALGLSLNLYRLAENWAERISVTVFLLKLTIARLRPSSFGQGDAVIRLKGATYFVGLRSAEIYTFGEFYQDHFYDKVADYVPKADWIVFDIGANVGLFTVQQARRKACVYAFEPNPDCYRRLSKAVDANRLNSRVSKFNYALGSSPGTGTMRIPLGYTTSGTIMPSADTMPGTTSIVEITSLDEIVPRLGVAHVDLLKIDVEGAEVEVLRGAVQTLENVERIIVEFHSRALQEQVSTFLDPFGYSVSLLLDTDADKGVGLLYARR